MRKISESMAVVAALLVLSGCASNLMRPSASEQISPPGTGRAKVVFMRSSIVAAAIRAEIFEVVNGDLRFIGQLSTGNKIVYETSPGEKVFMAYGTAADFMTAKLVAGKTYYSIVRPNWGTGGFAPTPIRTNTATEPNVKSKEFGEWVADTKLVEPNETAQAWLAENKARYQEIYKDYWNRFERKNSQEKAQRMLMPEDGVSP